MLEVLILFPSTADQTAVDEVASGFVRAISEATGVRSVRTSSGGVMARGGPSPFQRVIEVSVDSLADWVAWVTVHPMSESALAPTISPLVIYFEVAAPEA